MGILRIVMIGYGSQLLAGKVTEQQRLDFENYCEKNHLDINEVWYENENDEMNEFFNVDDCMDIYDFDVDGITFKNKTDLDAFLSGENSSVKIKIYFESPTNNHSNFKEIKINLSDITLRQKKKKTLSGKNGSVSVYYGHSCNGLFDCILPLFKDFDPKKLVLNCQYWGDYGYIISSAEYEGNKDDFCFHNGGFINNFELTFE